MKKRILSFILAAATAFSLTSFGVGGARAATNTRQGTAADVVAVALAQKDGSDGSTYAKWGKVSSSAWCAAFVCWCADQAGAGAAVPKNGACVNLRKAVLNAGGKVVKTPQPGDLILYYCKATNRYVHVGLVVSVSGGKVRTVQGNYSNGKRGHVVDTNVLASTKFRDAHSDGSSHSCTIEYVRPNYNAANVADYTPLEKDVDLSQTYNLVNTASGKVLDIDGGLNSSSNKSNAQIFPKRGASGSKSQQFTIKKISANWYTITPASNSKLSLNPFSDTPRNGTNVNVYTKDNTDSTQGWVFERTGNQYIIRSAYNNNIVLAAASTKDGGNVRLAAYAEGDAKQLWSITDLNGVNVLTGKEEEIEPPKAEEKPVSGKTYMLTSKASGKVLDVYGSTESSTNKSDMQIYAVTEGNKSQQFTITRTSGGWYSISPLSNSKLAVNPYADAPKNGTKVNVYTKDTADKSQGWIFEQVDDDYFIIRSAYNSSLVLTAKGGKDMSKIQVATYSPGNKYQLWSLDEAK